MELKRNGITVTVSDQVLEQLVLEKLHGDQPRKLFVTAAPGTLPRIGAELAELGGVFAGVVRGLAGESDYYLIVGPEAPGKLEWQPALDWADGVTHLGFSDFALFNRREQSICFGNVPELFQKEWYWSSEQHAARSDYAWVQYFYDGNQSTGLKGLYYRARAVRRVPIQ
jgi:hypothetical protein